MPGQRSLHPSAICDSAAKQEIAFLKENGVEMNSEKAKYSINKGLWGTSVGGKETLNSKDYLPEEAWPTPLTATLTDENQSSV